MDLEEAAGRRDTAATISGILGQKPSGLRRAESHRYHRNPEIHTASSFDEGQKLNPTFCSDDCRTARVAA